MILAMLCYGCSTRKSTLLGFPADRREATFSFQQQLWDPTGKTDSLWVSYIQAPEGQGIERSANSFLVKIDGAQKQWTSPFQLNLFIDQNTSFTQAWKTLSHGWCHGFSHLKTLEPIPPDICKFWIVLNSFDSTLLWCDMRLGSANDRFSIGFPHVFDGFPR